MVTQFPCRSCSRVTPWQHEDDPRAPTTPVPFLCAECASKPSSFTFVNGSVCYAGVPEVNGRLATPVPLQLFHATCDTSNQDMGDVDVRLW